MCRYRDSQLQMGKNYVHNYKLNKNVSQSSNFYADFFNILFFKRQTKKRVKTALDVIRTWRVNP